MSFQSEFKKNGYVAIPDLLDQSEVDAARQAISDTVVRYGYTDIGEVRREGMGRVTFQSTVSDCFVQFEPGYEPQPGQQDQWEPYVRKLMHYDRELPAFKNIAYGHPRLSCLLEQIIGPSPQLFQSMALIKPPFIGSEKPWHQDNAYFNVTPLDAVLGVWIALDDATVENGCMHVIPGGHRMGALKHHHDKDCEILAGRLNPSEAIPIELPAGGALIFYGMLPHQTPLNRSPQRRRALQFHYHAASAQRTPAKEYDAIYAEADGTPASCEAAREAGI